MEGPVRTIALNLLVLVGLCSTAGHAAAEDAGTFQLLGTAKTEAGSSSLRVTPVAIGPGWRGWSWYPSVSRPVAPYYGTANQVYGYGPTPVRAFNYYYRGANGSAHRH